MDTSTTELEQHEALLDDPFAFLDDDEMGYEDHNQSHEATATRPPHDTASTFLKTVSDSKEQPKKATKRRPKRDITALDLTVLGFVARVKYANPRQIALAVHSNENAVKQRLRGLKYLGLVSSTAITGRRHVWFLTALGLKTLLMSGNIDADQVSLARSGDFGHLNAGHWLAISQVTAQLLAGMKRAFGEAPIGDAPMTLANITTDYEMEAQLGKFTGQFEREHGELPEHAKRQQFIAAAKVANREERFDALINPDPRGRARSHRPDLLITTGEGKRIAVEVELYPKSPAVYADTFNMYRTNSAKYDYVLWVTQSMAVAKTLTEWRKKSHLDDRMDVVPLFGVEGQVFTDSAWTL